MTILRKIFSSILALGVFCCFGLSTLTSALSYTESESNNTFALANTISQSSVVTASLTAGDVDYFKFTPTTSAVYRVYTNKNVDTVVTLYEGTSKQMLSSSLTAGVCAYLKSGTTYYVKVDGYSSSTAGSYILYVASTTTYMDFGWAYMFKSPQLAKTVTTAYSSSHKAVDIIDSPNSCKGYSMYSVGQGTVLYANYQASMGWFAAINLNCGLTVRYLHMDSQADLKVSTSGTVSTGTLIGYVGQLGNTSTGYHLHFDINNIGTWDGSQMTTTNTYDPQLFFSQI